jgi:DNA invertase Pin-like site-specific DNA recombinase
LTRDSQNLTTSYICAAALAEGADSALQVKRCLTRQREGISKAKGEGKYKGRAVTAKAKANEVLTLRKAGKGPSEIAQALGIGRASVYRMLKEQPS